MKRMLVVLSTAVALVVPTLVHAQANFSGKWTYDQAKSGRGTAGNNPSVSFPTDLVIKHTPTEFDLETSTTRQEAVKAVYKLDGSEMTVPGGAAGVTLKGKARVEGDKLVIESTRSFSSPAGPIVNEFKEVYSVSGNALTVEKTQNIGGQHNVGTAVYNKTS